uniref:Venom dipeptidyl peptidase 4 n=1 Tax=Hemiscolopendra marginata TaxID=943146 RepID=A0A646QBZ2_9MYRI
MKTLRPLPLHRTRFIKSSYDALTGKGHKHVRKPNQIWNFINHSPRKSSDRSRHFARSKELVATSSSQRNWRGIGIALLVILVVCALIITAVVLLTPGNEGPRVRGERITLDDILQNNFSAKRFNGTWISDYEFAFQNESNALFIYNIRKNNITEVVLNNPFRRVNAADWSLSADRKYILLTHDVLKVFRHSFLAKYTIYDIIKGDYYRLTPNEGIHPPLQYAAWSPKGSAFVMVYKNDIYYKSNPLAETSTRITNTGLDGTVWNGIPDWVYEEEILNSNHALWFSNDGQMLCFATFNDSKVGILSYLWYGSDKSDERYPQIASVRYPKPDTPNPSVTLYVCNASEPEQLLSLTFKSSILQEDHYFTAVRWVNNSHISVIWMNRAQNISLISLCNAPFWYCNESHRVESGKQGWVDLYTPPLFSKTGDKYFVILPAVDGSSGSYPQVARKNVPENTLYFLTHGKWEVTSIEAYDEEMKTIYYIAAPEGKPGQRHLYQIDETKSDDKLGECLTCELDPECLYVNTKFSVENSYFILECLGPGVPKIFLFSTRNNKTRVELNSNSVLEEFILTKAMPQIRTFRVPLSSGYEAHVRLYLPPGLRDEEITTYPLIIEVYAGPGSQSVSEMFKIGLGHYLSSQRDMIYGFIDARGSGFQGNRILFEIYRQLGTVEVQDQVEVTKYLKEHLHFIDNDKVAIWGWSYGGYVTAMIMGMEEKAFNCGISVAPVTNWMNYDSVYTERYMGKPTPQDNQHGYDSSNVMRIASNFKNKKFFLVHGTADDNVHFQQSMLLVKALTKENVIFRTQVYPDESHALSSVRKHLYLSIEEFLNDCFHEDTKEQVGLQTQGTE